MIRALAALCLVAACATGSTSDGPDADVDATTCPPSALGPGGCVEPSVGACCTAGEDVCQGPSANQCCLGYIWTCRDGAWTKQAVGCPCTDDGGEPPSGDAAADAPGSHGHDASTTGPACGKATCDKGTMCLNSTIVAGPCQGTVDGGGCAKGTMKVGACCTPFTTTHVCRTPPAACSKALTCTCDPEDLCATTNMCTVSGETLTCLQEGT